MTTGRAGVGRTLLGNPLTPAVFVRADPLGDHRLDGLPLKVNLGDHRTHLIVVEVERLDRLDRARPFLARSRPCNLPDRAARLAAIMRRIRIRTPRGVLVAGRLVWRELDPL